MTSHDDEHQLSDDEARFVRALEAAYRPPEPGAGARARFAARLDERIARERARRPWLLAGSAAAAAAAALVLSLWPAGEPAGPIASDAPAAGAEPPSTEEALLLLANGPLADPDEALPEDYQMLADLLE
jgi:hypothetical protein